MGSAERPETFAAILRRLRTNAGLTQEELAERAGVSARSVSDLERGVAGTARRDTARLLAEALKLPEDAREAFEATARGRAVVSPVDLAGPRGGAAAAYRALPRDISSFTGRGRELARLVSAVGATGSGGVVDIHAIGGMAGVGKTAFAVHAAHRLAPQFPDGQIFLPLHGHTPGQSPVDPSDALASLLQTMGVATAQIPADLPARTALWRNQVAGKRLLLVFDDAADSEQVRPLLPGSAGSLVIVTSRRHLTALEDAQVVSLDTLAPSEAADLLVRLAGGAVLDAGDPAVAEITRLCGYLPLAIGMLARQLHHHPAWSVAELAADLGAARDRLELLHTENLSVAAAFDLSYAELSVEQQRLFGRLGLHPGADIDVYAAAALDGTDIAISRRHLDALYDHYLISEPTRGRYRFHALIREHARTLAALDSPAERDAAVGRLLDYYSQVGTVTGALLSRQNQQLPPPEGVSPAGAPGREIPTIADRAEALAWARAERANLLACLDHVTGTGDHPRVVALTAALAALLRYDGPWTDAIDRHLLSASAARNIHDLSGEAAARKNLGDVLRLTGNYPDAAAALEEALKAYHDLGDRLGEANTLGDLGQVRWRMGEYPAAMQTVQDALAIYRDLDDRLGEANSLVDVGAIGVLTDDIIGSLAPAEEALRIYRELGDHLGAANALRQLGHARIAAGDYPEGAQALEQALGIYRELDDRVGEAFSLLHLGEVQTLTGDYASAAEAVTDALRIYRDLGERLGEAGALLYLGRVQRLTEDLPGATQTLDHAIDLLQDLGERGGEAEALNEAATLYRICDNLDRATALHQRALELARDIGSPWDEAHALAGLGRIALAAGRTADALTGLQEAQEIFERIGAAEASAVAAELNTLPVTPPQSRRARAKGQASLG